MCYFQLCAYMGCSGNRVSQIPWPVIIFSIQWQDLRAPPTLFTVYWYPINQSMSPWWLIIHDSFLHRFYSNLPNNRAPGPSVGIPGPFLRFSHHVFCLSSRPLTWINPVVDCWCAFPPVRWNMAGNSPINGSCSMRESVIYGIRISQCCLWLP